MNNLFTLRGSLDRKTTTTTAVCGFILIMTVWITLTALQVISPALLPSPFKVITSYAELHFQDALVRNLGYSMLLNFLGYLEAVTVAILIGFPMGLFPVFRSAFAKYVNAGRFVPLTAVTGVFIAWFGIETNMKIQFLAFGILVYVLPVVIQRIDEVEAVYEQTAITLGATMWQRIKHVFIPSVLSKLSSDIRVLVAISWTYIIVAEMINSSEGGIGALAYTCARQSRIDKVFAVLLVIIMVGFIQDKLFEKLDKTLFPHKYV